jgi:hypothetical protein
VNWKIPYFRHDLGQVELEVLAGVLEGDELPAVVPVSGSSLTIERGGCGPT